MIINIENDPQKGPGYARITLRSRSGEAMPEPASVPEFMIESPGRGEFLGNGQWVQSEVRLPPDGYTYENGAIVLSVGPQIVDNLEALENYRFSITLPAGEKSGALVCKNLIPSPMQGGRTGFGNFETRQPEPAAKQEPAPELIPEPEPVVIIPPQPAAPPPAPEPVPQQTPEPAQAYTPPDFNQISEPPLYLSPDQGVQQGNTFEQLAHGRPPQKSGGGKTVLILLLIILLLAALAAGAWYFLSNRDDSDGTTPDDTTPGLVDPQDDGDGDAGAQPGEDDPEGGVAADPANDSGSEPQDPSIDEPGSETPPNVQPKDSANLQSLHLARGILRDNPSDDDLRRALTMMPLDDSNADANFLLREELAERGDAESMFMLGQFYDPAVNLPRGSIERDPEQALNWYRQAQSGGWQSTGPALDNLKSWLQQEAETGNPLAESLLNSME